MALLTTRSTDLPEGAVRLTEREALAHQKSVVQEWPSEIDVLFLKYGSWISYGSSLVASGLVLNHFSKLVPNRKRVLPFLLPVMFLPGYISYVGTEHILTKNTLLMKLKCPLCQQAKFAALQAYSGILAPALFGITAYVGGTNMIQAYVPHGPLAFWKAVYGLFRGGSKVYYRAGLIQMLTVFALPYMQAKEFFNVMDVLRTSNQELLES